MKRFMILWVSTMLLIALLVSCTIASQQADDGTPVGGETPAVGETPAPQATSPSDDGQLIRAELDRAEAPGVDSDQVSELVKANNSFATDLYQNVAQSNEDNLIFSPYSISQAFSMVYAGARGETQAQMMEVLHFLPQETQHPAFNALEQYLAQLPQAETQGIESGEPFQLDVTNAVWGQEGTPFVEAYLETLARQYGAGLRAVDFAQNPESAHQAINDWVAEATQDRIQNMVPRDVINTNTRLVLANAIYFYGAWLFPFNQEATEDGEFALLDGTMVTVPLMFQHTARVPYVEGDGYRAAQLPYTGQKADMLVILPDEGRYTEVEAGLDAAFLQDVHQGLQTRDVTLTLPRFEFDSALDLADLLQEMGLTNPFGGEADFSGIIEGGGLFIDAALHKGTITVDEIGTEAAAATVIAMAESAMERGELEATRPFIFAIAERDTGTVLFLGRVLNPAQ